MDPHNGKILPEAKVSGAWGRLIQVLRVYRPVAWLVFLTASLVCVPCMDAFPDAYDYLARPVGPGNPVEYAAGFQHPGGLVGVVRRPALGRLGFPVL